jgi:hypothetical protein
VRCGALNGVVLWHCTVVVRDVALWIVLGWCCAVVVVWS